MLACSFFCQSPEAPAERNLRFDILDSLFREMMPAPTTRLFQNGLDWCEIVAVCFHVGFRSGECRFVPIDHLLHHLDDGDAGQVRTPRGRGQRKGQTNEVMGRVAHHGLIQIANLNLDFALRVGQGANISECDNPHISRSAALPGSFEKNASSAIRRSAGCFLEHKRGPTEPSSLDDLRSERAPGHWV